MAWNESKPAASDPLFEFPSVVTANAIALRTALEKHSFWTDSSGVSAGVPRLSDGSFGPGAARAFYDVASNLSSTVSATKPLAGRLYLTSNTTRLYGYTSALSILLGSTRAIVYKGGSAATIQSNVRVLVQAGSAAIGGSTATVTFPTAYTAVTPIVEVTPFGASADSMYLAQVNASTTTSFGCLVRNVWGAGAVNTTVLWRSHGTVTL